MAIADLPAEFEAMQLTGPERRACDLFLRRMAERAPQVTVIGPRRTQHDDIKIMLEFPEGNTWKLTKEVARIANEARREFNVFLILD